MNKHKENLKNRRLACQCSAAMADNETSLDRMWSLTVFFESYMGHGSKRTRKWMNILPKTPAEVVSLKVIK